MNPNDREVKEGTQYQGKDEEVAYNVTTTPWGSSPSGVTVMVLDETNNDKDVTSSVTSGSTNVSGDVITLLTIKSLAAGHRYRVEVEFTTGGNVLELHFIIEAQK